MTSSWTTWVNNVHMILCQPGVPVQNAPKDLTNQVSARLVSSLIFVSL